MARIEHIRQRLENWARWSQERDAGGSGYPRVNILAKVGGTDNWGRNSIPTNSIEASETDDAVRSLQLTRSHLYLTLTLHYAKGLPIHQVSTRLHKAESTIKRHLEEADLAIERWLQGRAEARRNARVA
jgi:DNA-directed RNA polymerase specialized sigma24 family protein